ncbi:unnamed protein product, partial [Soboliphyme baturini]|uniref:Prion-like-(Q/N-rich) domain-bearing protein 25 n=1 Tax=Soboliphyme baturini TaxID=241478 RepID=A0A183ITT2_9BILA
MTVQRPGSPCQYSQQCSGAEPGAFCVNLHCHCVYGMVATDDGKCTFVNTHCTQRGTIWVSELGQCLPVIAPGNSICTHDQQCTAAHAESRCFLTQCTCPSNSPVAVDGVCGFECSSGETFSGVLNKCIKTQPGDQCQYSSQCSAIYHGLICDRGSCRCPSGQYWNGSGCSVHCPAGQRRCHSTGMCKTACLSSQVEHDGSCYEPANVGDRCGEMSWCAGGSSCVQGVCRCPLGSTQRGNTCVNGIAVKPGGSCANGEECSDGSVCENNVCTCPRSTILFKERCVVPKSVPPGASCHSYVRCSGGSVCINGVCLCPRRSSLRNDRCVYKREGKYILTVMPPFSLCTDVDVCTGGSFCQDSRCKCPEGYAVQNSKCVKKQAKPGDSCTAHESCVGGSTCVNGICACSRGYKIRDGVCTSVVIGAYIYHSASLIALIHRHTTKFSPYVRFLRNYGRSLILF